MAIFGFLASLTGVCVGDAGYMGAAVTQALATIDSAGRQAAVTEAMMRWQRSSNGAISDIRQKLADRRMVIAEEILTQAKITWEKEKLFVDETMDAPLNTAFYGEVPVMAAQTEKAWAETDAEMDRLSAKIGIPLTGCDDNRVAWGMALAKSDIMAHTMRVAESRTVALNDRRFSRQYAVLGLGKGVLRNAASMGQLSAGREAARNTVVGTINSGLSLMGYQDTRIRSNAGWTIGPNENSRVVPKGNSLYEINLGEGKTTTVVLPDTIGDMLTKAKQE